MVKKSATKTPPTKTSKSTKATKATKATKTTKATKATKVAKTTVTAAPAVDENTLSSAFIELLGQLTSLRSQLTTITGHVRTLQKRTERELKLAKKLGKKRVRKSGTRAPSGFVKPTLISLELAEFLKKPKGTFLARTSVTREINSYIRTNSLQDPKNGRRILPDAKLRKLLKVGKGDELTYFNLQRYMSPHFAKAGQEFPAANTVVA